MSSPLLLCLTVLNRSQFLESVLNSIGSGKPPIAVPQGRHGKPEQPTQDKHSPAATAKRKASGELTSKTEKLQRPSSVPSSRDVVGGSKPAVQKDSKTAAPLAQKRSSVAAVLAVAAAKPTPKKGSYQEIMARSNSAAQVGTLTHKPKTKERLSTKRELQLQKELAKQNKNGARRNLAARPRHEARGAAPVLNKSHSGKAPEKSSKPVGYQGTAKPKPQISYQGTAKPNPLTSTYKGTAIPGKDAQRNRPYDSAPDQARSKPLAPQRKRPHSDIESEMEEASDDGYTYASSDYSDMDAGFDDVDEEEAAAERQAKKEDVWEQRRLEELARQKAQRKNRLMAESEQARALKR